MTRQRVATRHNEDDGIQEKKVPCKIAMHRVTCDETDVGLEGNNALHDAGGIPSEELHRYAGVATAKRDHEFRRVVGGGRGARCETKNAHAEVARLGKALLGLVENCENAADIL